MGDFARVVTALALAGAVCSVTGISNAEAGGDFQFSDHLLSVNAMLGFGTPVGLAGGVLEVNPLAPLSLGVGAGTNTEGLQLAVMARGRPFVWSLKKHVLAITVAAAFAAGPHRPGLFSVPAGIDHSSPEEQAREVEHAYERVFWLQPDLGFELQAKSGFHLLVASGAAVAVSHSGERCIFQQSGQPAACPSAERPETLGTATVMLGYAF